MEIVLGIIVIACGVFSICGGIFNWEWFYDNYMAEPVVAVFGRTGARIVYSLLGIVLVVLGIVAIVALG